MAQILVGTSSWADPTLLNAGTFYPPAAKTARSRLQFYSSQFPLVEVDSSYYAIPAEKVAGQWAEATPADFAFDVKSFRLFTHHPTPPAALPRNVRDRLGISLTAKKNIYLKDLPPDVVAEMWRRFENALLPLDSAGKLSLVSFQFPQWFLPGPVNNSYLLSLKEKLPQYRLSVEFRAASWMDESCREEVFSLLRRNGLSYVSVDEPQGFRSSLPPLAEATTDIGVVRFHGRNRDAWEKPGLNAAQRFNYLYSGAELQEWVPRIKRLASRVAQVHVLFNNCYGDKAVVNAQQLRLFLKQQDSATHRP